MKKSFVVIFLLFLSIASCSRLDIAVNLANSYLTNKTDDYFNLTSDQKKWLKAALTKDIALVKKTILPQLATELQRVANTISTKQAIDTSMVLLSYERLENLIYQTLRVFTPDAVIFADKLTAPQITYFQNEFDKKITDLKDDPEKKSYDRIKKQFDSWMGSMNADQKKKLKQFIANNPPPINETIYNRQVLAHGFVRAFPDKAARKKYVEKLFNDYALMREPGYIKLMNEKNKKVAGFVASILNTMTDDQRQILIENLRDRASQLNKISKE